jgi:hypothetical protein
MRGRVESRAKSLFAIEVSDSDRPGREWDGGGLRDDDLYAFVRADHSTFPPTVGQPIFFTSATLHNIAAYSKRTERKAAAQGSEITRRWRAWRIPKKSGWLRGIDGQDRLVCEFDDGSQYAYWQWRTWPTRWTYLESGARIEAGATMVAGIVEPPRSLTCPGAFWNVGADLRAEDATTVYAAVKAGAVLGDEGLLDALAGIAEQANLDWRVRLEAHASLARLDPAAWTGAIRNLTLDPTAPYEQRMEAVFILSEIPTDDAAEAMAEIAARRDERAAELRAAAVWGLGRGVRPRPELLLPFAADPVDLVSLHAIVALQGITEQLLPTLVAWLGADDRHAASAATILARHEQVHALLTAVDAGGRARLWALQALGGLAPQVVRAKAAGRLTDAVERQLEPLWISQRAWLRGEARDGLDALSVQTVRFDPVQPG